jgi:hypothetical protein
MKLKVISEYGNRYRNGFDTTNKIDLPPARTNKKAFRRINRRKAFIVTSSEVDVLSFSGFGELRSGRCSNT